MRYAVVDAGGVIQNFVLFDGGAEWTAPERCAIFPYEEGSASIGWLWNSGAPVDPNPPPPPPPPPVPLSATSGDFMRALIELDWYDAAKAAVDNLAAGGAKEGKLARVLWDRASIFRRDDPMVRSIAAGIGKTDADLEALYRLTATY